MDRCSQRGRGLVTRRYVPDRGDAIWLHFDPQLGHEQSGHRPALVLSPARYNERAGLAILCPITSRKKGHPFEVELPPEGRVSGVVLADQVKSVDWRARRAELIERLPDTLTDQALAKLATLLG